MKKISEALFLLFTLILTGITTEAQPMYRIGSEKLLLDRNEFGARLPRHIDAICQSFLDISGFKEFGGQLVPADSILLKISTAIKDPEENTDYLDELLFPLSIYAMRYVEKTQNGTIKMEGASWYWLPVVDVNDKLLSSEECLDIYFGNEPLPQTREIDTTYLHFLDTSEERVDNLEAFLGFELDYSSNSLELMSDKFYELGESVNLEDHLEEIIAYMGEIIVNKFGGKWAIKLNQSKWTPYIEFSSGELYDISRPAFFSVQKRFQGYTDFKLCFMLEFPEHLIPVYLKKDD